MPVIERSALVSYTSKQMYDLVDDIESYPEFLPWCHNAVVHQREDDVVEASIGIESMGIQKSFTTRNALKPHSEILLNLVEGPFEKLEGLWTFKSLGDEGCKVSLHVEYEHRGGWAYIAFGAVFSHIAGQLVDAFVERANAVLGEQNV